MASPYVWKSNGVEKQLYLRADGRTPLDSRHVGDKLTAAEREATVVPPLFWDYANARPRIRTPPAIDFAISRMVPSRKQGNLSTCVPFAILAGVELCAFRKGMQLDLSCLYANWLFNSRLDPPLDWCCSGHVRMADSIGLLTRYGVCREDLCPYDKAPADCRGPTKKMHRHAHFGISEFFFIDRLDSEGSECAHAPCIEGKGITNAQFLECILAQNHDIVVVVDWIPTNINQDIIVTPAQVVSEKPSCCPRSPSGSHALVIVGYNRIGRIPYFVCRNSADEKSLPGHVFLSYDYIRSYARYGAVVMKLSKKLGAAPAATSKKKLPRK